MDLQVVGSVNLQAYHLFDPNVRVWPASQLFRHRLAARLPTRL